MRDMLKIILCILLSLGIHVSTAAFSQERTDEGAIEEEILEESGLAPRREEAPEEETLPPSEEEPEEKAPTAGPAELERPIRREAKPKEGEELRQVVIDSLVNLNYVFNNSPDSFILKYHLHLEGKAAASTAVIKGNAEIATEVTGFLAKWPSGNCKLTVNIPDSPFEMTFKKSSEDKASIDLKFKNAIFETWESQCTFQDASNAKFNTKGEPEKWLAKALEKARPPLGKLNVELSDEESTTMKFEIGKQTIKDPPLGSAEVEGTGIVTINPAE